MNNSTTFLEIINHIILKHPELASQIGQLAANSNVGYSPESYDSKSILTFSNNLLKHSKAQIRQDLFVLFELNFKKNGYFIEFGATDGVYLSNTYMLEEAFDWRGILAEPAKIWWDELIKNRRCHIEKKCVWHTSNEIIEFNETDAAGISTINSFSNSDVHAEARKNGKLYQVETISINDLLEKFAAPNEIDYLSIDTEGSEFSILSSLNFNKYKIKIITCEHNFSPARENIFKLLTRNGYMRKHEELSRFDDWYVLD